jgi:hypothetical protein
MSRSLTRGDNDSVRLVVHTYRDQSGHPNEGNASWFETWQARPEAKQVAWAGRQALLVAAPDGQRTVEVGIRLGTGCSLGLVARGLTADELVSAFSPRIDLAVLEKALDRGSPPADARGLADAATQAFRERRHAACYEALRRLQGLLDQGCRERMKDVLAAVPAGWTGGDESDATVGRHREWARGQGETMSAWLTWEDSTHVNGWFDALHDPAKRMAHQTVVEVAGTKVLLEHPSLEWEQRVRHLRAHVFFFDAQARLSLSSEGVAYEAGIGALLAALDLAKLRERLAPLW